MDPLASVDDIDIGRELTTDERNRAERLLVQASARFRREARQEFTPGASTVRLKVTDRVVFLPQFPVVEVLSVVGDDGRPFEWRRLSPTSQEIQLVLGARLDIRPGVHVEAPGSGRRPAFVVVHYTHGGEVPADVAGAVAGAVVRVLTADPDAALGVSQLTESDTRGPFARSRTRQFASWAVGGQLLLSPDDVALARSYRVAPPRLWVMKP